MARTTLTAGRIVAGRTTDLALPADIDPLAVEQASLRYGPEVVVHRLDGVTVPLRRTA